MRNLTLLALLLLTPTLVKAQEEKVPSYFRFDQDYLLGAQLWAGATYPISDVVGFSMDVFLPENSPSASGKNFWWSELDMGLAFTLGPITITPTTGIAFDWASRRAVALNVPQLYLVATNSKLYFEAWLWTLLFSPFKNPVYSDYIHSRGWLLYKVSKVIGVGPQFEYTYNLNTQGSGMKGMVGAPLGAHVELAFGGGNSLGLFAGYDLSKSARDASQGNAAEGRITFVHNF
jgi:hypothetical protein